MSAEIINQAVIVLKEGAGADPLYPYRFVVSPRAIKCHEVTQMGFATIKADLIDALFRLDTVRRLTPH